MICVILNVWQNSFGWKVGKLENWKVGKLESWKVGRLGWGIICHIFASLTIRCHIIIVQTDILPCRMVKCQPTNTEFPPTLDFRSSAASQSARWRATTAAPSRTPTCSTSSSSRGSSRSPQRDSSGTQSSVTRKRGTRRWRRRFPKFRKWIIVFIHRIKKNHWELNTKFASKC